MASAKWLNEEQTFGEFVRPNGMATYGPLPPNAGDVREEYEAWLKQGHKPEPYVAPPPLAPADITRRQFYQQLAVSKIITRQEALEAVRRGAIPEALAKLIEGMDEEEQFSASMLLSGAAMFERSHPLTESIAKVHGLKPEQMDEFFRAALAL